MSRNGFPAQLDPEQLESKLRADASAGDRAKELAENPILQEYFKACEEDIIGEFVAADESDTERVMRAKRDYHALGRLVDKLQTAVDTGHMAREQLNTLRTQEDRRKTRKDQLLADHDLVTDYEAELEKRKEA